MRYKGTLLVVKDCKKAYQFYRDVFGFELIHDNDGNMELSDGLYLQEAGYWEKFTGKNTVPYSNHSELYFEEPDIDGFVEKLETLYPETEYVNRLMTHSWGQRVVRFYDPDGNLIEAGTPVPPFDEYDRKTIETERLYPREMDEKDYDAFYRNTESESGVR